MHLNKPRLQFVLLATAILLTACAGFLVSHKSAKSNKISSENQATVSPEDKEQLPLTAETIKHGRAVVVPVLMYHHIGDLPNNANKTRQDLTVSKDNFEQQVRWLSKKGYNAITLNDIYLFSQSKFTMPKKPVVFTFDDGYEDAFENAIPILKQYGYSGTFAIITQWPGQTQGDNIYAPWSEIAAAYIGGNEIVSHTQNHFDGTSSKFNSDYIFTNLSGSINDIKQNLGFTTNILIYPYGHYTDRYITQAKKAGFVMGLTVQGGKVVDLGDLMHIPRIRVHGQETLEKFEENIGE